ncbi:MAG TPA: DUF4282 domain-containing protein [Gemmataceae bacterium]|nr:DUF4282 domain-containing protein [Gemmataceae bacterium]
MNNSCPNCGTVYNITPQLIGKSTSCKKCGAQLVIDASGLQLAGGGGGGGQFRPGSDFDFRPTPRGPSAFGDFITFRKNVSPFIVKYILFWLLVALSVYSGIRLIIAGFQAVSHSIPGAWAAVGLGFIYLIVGPIFIRFACELMLLAFKFVETHSQINDSLKDIKKDMQRK